MKYYLVVGEASGDLHAANLVKELKQSDSNAQFRGFGGDKMKDEGVYIHTHIKDLAFMGFWEVIKNLNTIFKNIRNCKEDIISFKPDVVILVDYPGFNFRLLKFLKVNNFKIVYYISPQIWAWRRSRALILKKYVDLMLVIFPFEPSFFEKFEMRAEYVGHPLLDVIPISSNEEKKETKKHIALLPGSRKQEIEKMLPIFNEVSKYLKNEKFKIAGMSLHGLEYYQKFISSDNVELELDNTYFILQNAKAALVTSGTATLETALWGVPQAVCYKGSNLSYIIGKMLVEVPYISIVNLIANKEIVKEFIQNEAKPEDIKNELLKLMSFDYSNKMKAEYKSLRIILGDSGASKKASNIISSFIKKH